MIIHDSKHYRIEYLPSISTAKPYALDHKERTGDTVVINNIGWFATPSDAYVARNQHAGWTKMPEQRTDTMMTGDVLLQLHTYYAKLNQRLLASITDIAHKDASFRVLNDVTYVDIKKVHLDKAFEIFNAALDLRSRDLVDLGLEPDGE